MLIKYYAYYSPFIISFTLPIALLLATFFSIGGMTNNREIIAMSTGGLSLYRILFPVYMVGVISFIFSLALNEMIVPRTEKVRLKIENEHIRRKKSSQKRMHINIYLSNPGGWIYFVRRYEPDYLDGKETYHGKLKGLILTQYYQGSIKERIDAKEAFWKGDTLTFLNGNHRVFDREGLVSMTAFDTLPRPDLKEQPEDFSKQQKAPAEMDIFELAQYINKVRNSGGDTTRLVVDWHYKITMPFANLIFLMIGLPLASIYRRSAFLAGFGLSYVIVFLYWLLLQFGKILGRNGVMSPFWAAWGVNIIFVIAGIVLLLRVRK
jgi:lipopolysaccharide export system permease protein